MAFAWLSGNPRSRGIPLVQTQACNDPLNVLDAPAISPKLLMSFAPPSPVESRPRSVWAFRPCDKNACSAPSALKAYPTTAPKSLIACADDVPLDPTSTRLTASFVHRV